MAEPSVLDHVDAPAWHIASPISASLSWRGAMESTRSAVCKCGANAIAVKPAALRDSWSRTFYEPLLVKNDAAALLGSIPAESEATVEIDCALQPIHQFDQVSSTVGRIRYQIARLRLALTSSMPSSVCRWAFLSTSPTIAL
jgi:hypothetical protein